MFVASRLPDNSRVSGWVQMLPARAAKAFLDEAITADVVIIGGGFAGLSAARRLSLIDPQLRVVVLEAGVVGDGPAGRNSGFIIDLPHEVSSDDYGGGSLDGAMRDIKLYRTAIALAKGVAEERGWGREVFDPCGRYNVAMKAKGDAHIQSYAAQLKRLNEPHTLLDSKQITEVTGCEAYSSGLYMPGTVMVQPAAYVRGLADSLRDPVRLFENTPVLSFERQGGAWLVKTAKGAVSASKVILANNGHAQSFGFFPGLLMHIYTYASLSEPFDPKRLGGQRSWAATPAFPMGTTVRRIQGGDGDRLLIRSRYSYHAKPEVSDAAIASAGRAHDRKFAARFPGLKDLRMQYRWGGAMALTLNGVPAFGELEPGLISACGCNGLGASKSTAAGIAAADFAVGERSELVTIFQQFAAPKPLPPQPFLSIGAKANLRIKEWVAGLE